MNCSYITPHGVVEFYGDVAGQYWLLERIKKFENIVLPDTPKLEAARKVLAAIAASKCDCAGCVMVRAIVAFMGEP